MTKEFFTSLLKVQKEIPPIKHSAENPYFNSTYADLGAIHEVVNPILHKNGFIVIQPIQNNTIETHLIHESGEEIISIYPIIAKSSTDPQAYGSACTYGRRYSLSAILNLVTEKDDDGNKATHTEAPKPQTAPATAPKTAPLPKSLPTDFIAEVITPTTKISKTGKKFVEYTVNMNGEKIKITHFSEDTIFTGLVKFKGVSGKDYNGKTYFTAKDIEAVEQGAF